MKKKILLFSCLLVCISCGGTNQSSSEIKLSPMEEVLSSISNNYSVNYSSANGKYKIYKTEDYIYDEELGGGQFVLYDNTMYIYTIHNDKVMPRTPCFGSKEEFNQAYPNFEFNKEKYVIENEVYTSTDSQTVEQVSLFINSTGYSKVSLFLDNDLLNIRYYDEFDKVAVTAKMFAINSTVYEPVETYLNNNIDPENETYPNQALVNTLSTLKDNFTFIGQNNTTKAGLSLLVNKDYVAAFSGDKNDKENLYGYISLDDGTHYYEIVNDKVSVDFEISAEKSFIRDNYFFKRHDYTKFKDIGDGTYLSNDYYNVKNFMDLLAISDDVCNLVKLKINQDKSVDIEFLYNHYAVYSGTIFDIGTSTIEELTSYVNGDIKPTLEKYDNAKLIEATKNLDLNFTYVCETEQLEEGDFGVYSNENGRRQYKPSYNNFPSTNYICYEDFAYVYGINENSASPKYYDYLTKEEYQNTYSFKAIDFTHFKQIDENKWMTNSLKYIKILSKILGSNPYQSYHFQATVEIKENGDLYFEILDPYFDINTNGYLKDINSTEVEIVDTYKLNNTKPTRPVYDNSALFPYIEALKGNNFTTKYHDDPAYDLYFTEEDYDYWTNDILYMGTYKAGFVTSSKSKYIYEYALKKDSETNVEYLAVNDHPSLTLSSIGDFNPFHRFSEEMINSLMPHENGYVSYDDEIINIAVEALNLQEVLAYLSFVAVYLEVNDNVLTISVIDEISVSYDENGVRNEDFINFATASFINVGTTTIPDFAIVPSIK